MLDATTLRSILKEIFGIDDKYLVPLDEGGYVPTFEKDNKVGTWIGYRILSKEPNLRGYRDTKNGKMAWVRPIKVTFRISFVGPQAETLADATLLWNDRKDVVTAFQAQQVQVDYDTRQLYSYPVKNGGLNDNLCWCLDITAHTFYTTEYEYEQWNLKGVDLKGDITIPIKGDNNGQ